MMELRSDGRKNDELRKIKGRMNVLKGCDGSAVFQLGNTKVLAVVYGPSDIQEWRLNYSELQDDLYVKCNLSVSSSTKMVNPLARMYLNEGKALEMCSQIQKIFRTIIFKDFFAKSRVEVNLIVIHYFV
ncbi:Exosome complex component Rrp41 [Thelohanellus kitauei]|uniref:Exosome complex component Rrp41 n=1 Tax=Thelohanellus kitauei TaxID=669202 RepID=A0A0C2IP78_THEKT|nr:Exosome complex component Rrp41 [Thelohanellus kitauei]